MPVPYTPPPAFVRAYCDHHNTPYSPVEVEQVLQFGDPNADMWDNLYIDYKSLRAECDYRLAGAKSVAERHRYFTLRLYLEARYRRSEDGTVCDCSELL